MPCSVIKGDTMKTILETIHKLAQFKTLKKAIKSTGLEKILDGSGPFTLFAPTDEAFASLYADILEVLFRDKFKLSDVLIYHVIPGYINKEIALSRKFIKTANGQTLEFSQNNNIFQVDQAHILEKDILCSNGIIHIIDAVLMPESYRKKAP
jgi:uncharacterized surface protein with fasciclin (FAS1) repeats